MTGSLQKVTPAPPQGVVAAVVAPVAVEAAAVSSVMARDLRRRVPRSVERIEKRRHPPRPRPLPYHPILHRRRTRAHPTQRKIIRKLGESPFKRFTEGANWVVLFGIMLSHRRRLHCQWGLLSGRMINTRMAYYQSSRLRWRAVP